MASRYDELGRRERQIMDILYQHGRATAGELMKALPGEPSDSTVRTQLRVLEAKGHVRHEWDGPRHVYLPAGNREHAQRTAARHVLQTFFNNSMESAVAAMLGVAEKPITPDEFKRLSRLIERARRGGGRP